MQPCPEKSWANPKIRREASDAAQETLFTANDLQEGTPWINQIRRFDKQTPSDAFRRRIKSA